MKPGDDGRTGSSTGGGRGALARCFGAVLLATLLLLSGACGGEETNGTAAPSPTPRPTTGEEGTPDAPPAETTVLNPAGPADPDPGLENRPPVADEVEEEADQPPIPQGFEDVAPETDGLVEGPFTRDGDEAGDEAAEGWESGDEADGSREAAPAPEARQVETLRVYLVEPSEETPSVVLGKGEAGSGERKRPDTRTSGQYAGSFGCDDRLVGLEVDLEEAVEVRGPEDHLRLVVQTLLDLQPEDVPGDLLNSLRRSPLQVESVEAAPGRPGVYRVQLSGPLRVGGTCDAPRVRAQLTTTAEQVEGVDEAEIFLGEQPLEVILSSRGTVRR